MARLYADQMVHFTFCIGEPSPPLLYLLARSEPQCHSCTAPGLQARREHAAPLTKLAAYFYNKCRSASDGADCPAEWRESHVELGSIRLRCNGTTADPFWMGMKGGIR